MTSGGGRPPLGKPALLSPHVRHGCRLLTCPKRPCDVALRRCPATLPGPDLPHAPNAVLNAPPAGRPGAVTAVDGDLGILPVGV